MGPFEPGMGPLRLKIDPCGTGEGPSEHVNCLFYLYFNSERLQYLIVRIEMRPLDRRRGEMSPLSAPLAAPLGVGVVR